MAIAPGPQPDDDARPDPSLLADALDAHNTPHPQSSDDGLTLVPFDGSDPEGIA